MASFKLLVSEYLLIPFYYLYRIHISTWTLSLNYLHLNHLGRTVSCQYPNWLSYLLISHMLSILYLSLVSI